ncbi:MAG: NAD-binding protein, partial [Spirochaetales bacterium]|nr:NAD-binding protein [Spirochaetales bacterium]
MSVVILGAGRRGARLARHLIEEKKSVIMIDWDNERCSQIMAKLDLMAICGSATDISVLEEAGAKEAEAIIAVTDSDEVNLVACGIAASNFPETKTIAAIRGISYLGKEAEHKGGRILGIDHIVNPEEEAAKRIAGIIKSGLFSDVIRFDDAEFILFTSYIQEGSMFQGKSLIEVKKMLDGQYVVIGIRRGKEVFSPSGGTVLMAGDELAVMAVDDDSDSIFSSFRGENSSIKLKKAFIVGGTRIARYLLRMMGKKTQERMVLIDKDSDICSSFAEEFPYLLVLNDSITDEEVWEDERLHNADLMISVTENDEL